MNDEFKLDLKIEPWVIGVIGGCVLAATVGGLGVRYYQNVTAEKTENEEQLEALALPCIQETCRDLPSDEGNFWSDKSRYETCKDKCIDIARIARNAEERP